MLRFDAAVLGLALVACSPSQPQPVPPAPTTRASVSPQTCLLAAPSCPPDTKADYPSTAMWPGPDTLFHFRPERPLQPPRAGPVLDLWKANKPDLALDKLLEDVAANRRDFGPLYAESSLQPEAALATITAATKDAELSRALVDSLAQAYLDRGGYHAARTVLTAALAKAQGPRKCALHAKRVEVALIADPAPHRDSLLTLALEQLALQQTIDDETCRDTTISLLTELATAWHIGNYGARGVVGRRDPKQLEHTTKLYTALETHYSAQQIQSARGSIPHADSGATRARILRAVAQLARLQKQWKQCGVAFDRAYAALGTRDEKAAAAIAAFHCHVRAGRQSEPEVAAAAANRVLCTVAPGYDRELQLEAELERGRVSFIAEKWRPAASALRALAFADHEEVSPFAAAMYVVALHSLRDDTLCSAKLASEKEQLLAQHCAPGDDLGYEELAIEGVTTARGLRRLSPCAAMRAVGGELVRPPPPGRRGPRIAYDTVSVSGAVVPEEVAWVLRLHREKVLTCYESALRRDDTTSGRHLFRFIISRSGAVSMVQTQGTALSDKQLEKCINRVYYGLRFPQPEGGIVDVRLEVALSPQEGVTWKQPIVFQPDLSDP